jgi:O-antigen ligase
MHAGITSPLNTRVRRRKTHLPVALTVLDLLALFLLSLLPVVGIWIFGGNRLWVMGPMILITLLAAMLVAYRFFISVYRRDWAIPPGGWWLLVFFLYLVAIIGFAEVQYDALLETMRFLSYVLAFWIWANLLRFQNRWVVVLALLMLSASLMAWYALIQDVHGTRNVLNVIRPEQYEMRASGAYICPNHFAHLMQMMIIIGAGVVACRRINLSVRLIAGYTLLICLPALYLTESRSGMIGLVAGLVTLFIATSLRKGFRKFLLVLIAAPVIAASAGFVAWKASPMLQERVALAMQGDVRLVIWKDSVDIVKAGPVMGSGLGSYRWMYPHFRTHLTVNADPEFAHNDYLHYWAEIGLVGVLFMAAVVLALVAFAVRVIRRDSEPDHAWLMGGMLGMMAGSLAHAMFDFNFHIFANTQVYIFLLAAMVAAVSSGETEQVRMVTRPIFWWMGWGLILVLAALGLLYGSFLISYAQVLKAERHMASMEWDEAQVVYRRAIAWSPGSWKAHIGYAHLLRTRSFWVRDRALKEEWLALSRAHYERSLAMNPWEVDAVYGLSGLYKMTGDQERALELRRKAVEMVPRNVFYLNELGLHLKDMGRYQEALEIYSQSRAVESSPAAERNITWLRAKLAEAP